MILHVNKKAHCPVPFMVRWYCRSHRIVFQQESEHKAMAEMPTNGLKRQPRLQEQVRVKFTKQLGEKQLTMSIQSIC